MEELQPVSDVQGPDVDDATEIRIIKEVELAAKCLIHGTQRITSQPRVLNLGYGRTVTDLGRTSCLLCGHSLYVTIELFETNWEKITVAQLQVLLRAALEAEYAANTPADDDEEEEEDTDTPAPEQPAPPPMDGQSEAPTFGDRPRF